jgi:hypothetical protein
MGLPEEGGPTWPPALSPAKSEDGVALRVDDLRLKERVTIHDETLALLFFSSVKVKRQPVTISDEAKQRLKLGVEHGKQKPVWSEICKREPFPVDIAVSIVNRLCGFVYRSKGVATFTG